MLSHIMQRLEVVTTCLLILLITVFADPPTCSYDELLFFAEYVPRRDHEEYVPYYVARNISRVEACAKFCHETYFCNVALYEPETQRCQIVYPKDKKCYLFNTRYRRYNPFGSTLIQCITCGDLDYRGRRFSLPNGGLGGKSIGAATGARGAFPSGNYGALPGGVYGGSPNPYGNAFGSPYSRGGGGGPAGRGGRFNNGNCVPNLCLNGGNIILYHDNTYECDCPKGYVGRLCTDKESEEKDEAGFLLSRHNRALEEQKYIMRPCSPNPCRNSGICLPGAVDRHFCICQPFFTGPSCQFLTDRTSNR